MEQTILNNQPQTVTEQIVINLSGKDSTLTGTQLKKKLSKIQEEKFKLIKECKADTGGIYSIRKKVCKLGDIFINELNAKHGTNFTNEFILSSDVNLFTQYLTDKEKEQTIKNAEKLGKDGNLQPVFSFFLFINLLSRYFAANKVKEAKKD